MFFNQYPYINENDLNLDWILKHMKEVLAAVDSMTEWKAQHEKEYEDLKKLVDDLYNGNFSDGFITSLVKWINLNLKTIIGDMIKAVFFELTPDGYFVAYFPEEWADLIWGTSGLDDFPAGVEFGHLTISY